MVTPQKITLDNVFYRDSSSVSCHQTSLRLGCVVDYTTTHVPDVRICRTKLDSAPSAKLARESTTHANNHHGARHPPPFFSRLAAILSPDEQSVAVALSLAQEYARRRALWVQQCITQTIRLNPSVTFMAPCFLCLPSSRKAVAACCCCVWEMGVRVSLVRL